MRMKVLYLKEKDTIARSQKMRIKPQNRHFLKLHLLSINNLLRLNQMNPYIYIVYITLMVLVMDASEVRGTSHQVTSHPIESHTQKSQGKTYPPSFIKQAGGIIGKITPHFKFFPNFSLVYDLHTTYNNFEVYYAKKSKYQITTCIR